MKIIKGSHSGSSKLTSKGRRSTSSAEGVVDDVLLPNKSFEYLTINSDESSHVDALLPDSNPAIVLTVLKNLGNAMIEESEPDTENSTIPPVYTYWGQFIDHDITAGTDRPSAEAMGLFTADILDQDGFLPVAPAAVVGPEGIMNLRVPKLDLDSVYGGGPTDEETKDEEIFQSDLLHLAIGTNDTSQFPDRTPNSHLPDNLRRDLPRHPTRRARTADARNDENTIVAQFHTAFLRFHNAIVDSLPGTPSFAEASQLVRWHYQWLVVNDYLKTICKDGIVEQILFSDDGFFENESDLFMPLEFSVAGFRFGHSMVRANYDFNMNFGRGVDPQIERSSFDLLFKFTGLKGDLGNKPQLPNNWIIDWARFTNKNSPESDRFARKIDTNLALPLTQMPDDTNEETGVQIPLSQLSTLQKHLAQRNLLRSYLLSTPTGQHVAKTLNVDVISPDDLIPPNKQKIKDALEAESDLLKQKTPLWYYILREAEVQTGGNTLGELGSHLVAGTLIGLLKSDSSSYLNAQGGWTPAKGVKLPNGKPIVRIMDLFQFAGVA